MSEFSKLNPWVILIYYIIVIFLSMFFNNPVLLLTSFVFALTMAIKASGWTKFKKGIWFYLIMFSLIVIINPIFVHQGATTLFYVNGNPYTLEAIVYGFVFGFILLSLILWFNSFNVIMTSDKIIYLFAKFVPTIGLIISMILRFIPRFQKHLTEIMAFSNLNNTGTNKSNIVTKGRNSTRTFSILLTWTFENSLDVANSMKSKGYGLLGRTSFHLFKFEKRDLIILLIMLGLLTLNIFNYYYIDYYFYYYPDIAPIKHDLLAIYGYVSYALLLAIPLIFEIKEDLKWRYLKSKI